MRDITDTLLDAMARDKNGDWDAAHTAVQALEDSRAYWMHAYLHRKEGDLDNAGYWYNRAGRPMPSCSLKDEWQIIHDAVQR